MPIGGKLMLKGGVPLKGSVKKSKHKKSRPVAADSDDDEQHRQQQEEQGQEGTQPGVHEAVQPARYSCMCCLNLKRVVSAFATDSDVVSRVEARGAVATATEQLVCMQVQGGVHPGFCSPQPCWVGSKTTALPQAAAAPVSPAHSAHFVVLVWNASVRVLQALSRKWILQPSTSCLESHMSRNLTLSRSE